MKEYELTKGKKILVLTLSKKPFEVMVTGEKYLEFRETKNWITLKLGAVAALAFGWVILR